MNATAKARRKMQHTNASTSFNKCKTQSQCATTWCRRKRRTQSAKHKHDSETQYTNAITTTSHETQPHTNCFIHGTSLTPDSLQPRPSPSLNPVPPRLRKLHPLPPPYPPRAPHPSTAELAIYCGIESPYSKHLQ